MILGIIGIASIAAGAYVLYTNGFFLKKDEKIAQVGDVKVTKAKSFYLSPAFGAGAIAVGVILLIIGML